MCWELKLFFEYWRQFLQSSIVTNGQAIREIFPVLLHVLCLSSEYICSLFCWKGVSYDTLSVQYHLYQTGLFGTLHSQTQRSFGRGAIEYLILFSVCTQQFVMYCAKVCAPLCSRVQSSWSCVRGWPPFPAALKQHCLTRLVNYRVVTDALSMNNSR